MLLWMWSLVIPHQVRLLTKVCVECAVVGGIWNMTLLSLSCDCKENRA